MIATLNVATPEVIERSKIICNELENPNITGKNRNELLTELETLTGKVLRRINEEILADLNNLAPLFRGHLLKRVNEPFEIEIENKEKIERWGWVLEMVNGEKRMYDPTKDETEREYKAIPKIKVERSRVVYICETNREQVWKIEELIKDFWEKCKTEYRQIPIDKILDAKRDVEYKIAKVDLSEMKKENLTEVEFLDADYIKKRTVHNTQAKDPDTDLFKKFDHLKEAR